MSLFTINRYMAEEDETEEGPTSPHSSQASEILKHIHQKAQARQLQLQGKKSDPPDRDVQDSGLQRKSSTKKRKHSLVANENSVSVEEVKGIKKKQKKEDSFSLSRTETDSDDDDSKTVSTPQKKKSQDQQKEKKTKNNKSLNGSVSNKPKSNKHTDSKSKDSKRTLESDTSDDEDDRDSKKQKKMKSKQSESSEKEDKDSDVDESSEDETPATVLKDQDQKKEKKMNKNKGLNSSISNKRKSTKQIDNKMKDKPKRTLESDSSSDEDDNDKEKQKEKVKAKRIKLQENTQTESETGKDKTDSDAEDSSEEEAPATILKSKGQRHTEVGGFTVIGGAKHQKVQMVHRVLPDWLANPSIVTNNLQDESASLDSVTGLDDDIKEKLKENSITYFFPVQRLIIPALLASYGSSHLIGAAGYRPSDICCSAPTGSGKTLAFVLPIIQALRHRVVREVRALVVLPIRDLAAQVFKVFTTYCQDTPLKVGHIIGQKVFSTEQQSLVKNGPCGMQSLLDIVVATPGRLVDHINRTPGFNLHHLRYLVIDEADRMMEDIKQDWLHEVEKAVFDSPNRPKPSTITAANASQMQMPLQKLLFSATLSQNPEKLEQLNLFHPKLFTSVVDLKGHPETPVTTSNETAAVMLSEPQTDFVGKYTTPDGLTEYFVEVNSGQKPLMMLYFLHHFKFRNMLCFANNIESTHRLYLLLKLVGGIEVCEFSSSLHAVQRSRILKRFTAGKIDVLVCSDAMARGMDVKNVKYVVCYDSAPYVKTYIHRIGRTARAGKTGSAFTLLESKEIFHFKKMLREAGKTGLKQLKIAPSNLKGFVGDYQAALKELQEVLKAEQKAKR